MPQEWSQDNVNAKINDIKALPENQRQAISSQIKADLRGWLMQNFEFTQAQIQCMQNWPQSMREETGFGIGTAVLYPEWSLQIIFPDNPNPPGPAAQKHHEQTVSGSYNTSTGSYSVTKSHTWSW